MEAEFRQEIREEENESVEDRLDSLKRLEWGKRVFELCVSGLRAEFISPEKYGSWITREG